MFYFFMPMLMGLLVLGGAFVLASRFLRTYERRQVEHPEITELRERIARLEDTLESTVNDVRRLSEAQHFTTQLLQARGQRTEPSA